MNYFHVYSALGVLLIISLAFNVSRVRIRERIAHGDGNNRALKKAIRAHMINFEHILPYGLLLLVLGEMNLDQELMAFFTFGFLAVRLMHAYIMLAPHYIIFRVSSALTYFFEFFACIYILREILHG